MVRHMSDEQLLFALLRPLAHGRNASEAEAWGLRLVGPERIERLAHGERRRGFRDPHARRWRGLVWDSEADVINDLQALGWSLRERRPPSHHRSLLVLSKPGAELNPDQWSPRRPAGPVKQLAKQLLSRRLNSLEVAHTTWPHGS
jgi:hypothetical protein